MSRITLSPEAIKSKIEKHFESKGLNLELQIGGYSQSGGMLFYICLIGEFNENGKLEFEIWFSRNHKALIKSFEGIYSLSELIEILSEIQIAIEHI